MFEWIANNAVTIITVAVLLVIVGIAVFVLVKDKKRGGVCTGNCATCRAACSHGNRAK